MDEFAFLRRRLYDTYGAFGSPEAGPATEALFAALLGEPSRADPLLAQVLAARLATEGAGPARPDAAGGAGAERGEALLPQIQWLGQSPYLDRYLTDALQKALPPADGSEIAGRLAAVPGIPAHPGRLAAALEMAAELGLAAFPAEQVLPLLGCEQDGLRAAAAHYCASTRLKRAVELLLAAAAEAGAQRRPGSPGDRGLEAASWAVAVALECGADSAGAAAEAERRLTRPGLARQLLYTELTSDLAPQFAGPVLVQTMFYGDPARPGRGNSGGIATLLRDLGDTLAAGGRPVLTVVPYNTGASIYPLRAVEPLAPGHAVLRLPLHLPSEDALGFLCSHGRLRAALRRLFLLCRIHPAVLHVRFLDDASLAAAREAGCLGAALVTTLTPDPHRGLCDPSGRLNPLPVEAGLEALNKVAIGDELLRRSRGIAAIGRRAVREQLLPYFPQLENAGQRAVSGIDEGIRLEAVGTGLDVQALFCDPSLPLRLDSPPSGLPVMLNVGRLSPMKGQLNLLRAWLERRWWRRYDLVLVGGDFRHPAPGEAEILGEIRRLAASCPASRGHLAHLEALPNERVRELEAFLGRRTLVPLPDLYVCSSLKEEFGLSILEAMAAGMVACAPVRGGARRYLRHGVNGYLIDTSGPAGLARDLEALLEPMTPQRARALQDNARETVRRGFSIQRVAGQFESLYRRALSGP
jgi:glycosyltransferase involved in cell wall biosynthesis